MAKLIFKIWGVFLMPLLAFLFPIAEVFAQDNCYGVWEYIPGSGKIYDGLNSDGSIGPYTKIINNDNPPFSKRIEIKKGSIYCDNYAIGYNEAYESGKTDFSLFYIMSNTPKTEDSFEPDGGYSYPLVLKKPGYPTEGTLYLDVEKRYSSAARFIGSCNDLPVYLSGGAFFNCSNGYYMGFTEIEGLTEAFYYRYRRIDGEAEIVSEKNIELIPSPKEVKPDGKSTVEITATLYSYIQGEENSSKPLVGKTLSFAVNEQYGIAPGTISENTVTTNAQGQAKVIFTSPDNELLNKSRLLINTATVTARCDELNIEETVYINFIPDRGKVWVEPNTGGIISEYGIVPPDKRFPALISAYMEDENLQPKANTEVTFTISATNSVGILRSPEGKEGKKLSVKTDSKGIAEVQYVYASSKIPDKALSETIEVTAAGMTLPLKAHIAIGLNLIFEKVENAYEGKGIVNAGEEIPMRVKIKDAWNPNLDISPIISYWGLGNKTGDTKLFVKLDVEPISTVPDFLLDQLKLDKFPPAPFAENMEVRSFKDKGEMNMLWMPENNLKNYKGYPRIKPMAKGNHYYEARVSLVDDKGREVPLSSHPARKAFFNIQTGLPADAMQIFFINNPFNTDTREAKLLATALDLMGFGALISIPDALFKINSGDTDGLFTMLFSEIKGVMLDKAKAHSTFSEEAVSAYTSLTLAEKIDFEIRKDKTGPIAGMEASLYRNLMKSYNLTSGQLVILKGNGNQKLIEEKEYSPPSDKKEVNVIKGVLKISISGLDKKTSETIDKVGKSIHDAESEIPAGENSFTFDDKRNISSFKKGGVTIFIVPADMNIRNENATEMKRY